MAFTDALIADSDATVVLADRRHAPGGHWNDAYPFVRLHQPSAFYGVNSLPLGHDRIDESGLNAGFYEQASGPKSVTTSGARWTTCWPPGKSPGAGATSTSERTATGIGCRRG